MKKRDGRKKKVRGTYRAASSLALFSLKPTLAPLSSRSPLDLHPPNPQLQPTGPPPTPFTLSSPSTCNFKHPSPASISSPQPLLQKSRLYPPRPNSPPLASNPRLKNRNSPQTLDSDVRTARTAHQYCREGGVWGCVCVQKVGINQGRSTDTRMDVGRGQPG